MPTTNPTAADFVRIEAHALMELAARMDGAMKPAMEQAVGLLAACVERKGRVIVSGMGKSGLIARKIAATLTSTGSPAHFLHAAEAVHGDVGMVMPMDVVVVLSYSGETEEIVRLLGVLRGRCAGLIAVCGCMDSTLGRTTDVALDASVSAEACSMNLAPTASTTVMLALGDALATEVSRVRGFVAQDFAVLHPGGRLGKRLRQVRELMHTGDRTPRVMREAALSAVIHEMSEKRLGMTTVVDAENRLLGVVSDGDLRRLLEREGGRALEMTAGEVMHALPCTVPASAFAAEALLTMEERRITSIIVTGEDSVVEGVVHLHDLWEDESFGEERRS